MKEGLACVNESCDLYGQAGQDNLIIRKISGKDEIRYLRCRKCQQEFSERKNTPLWNTKIREEKAISIAEHLAEGCSPKRPKPSEPENRQQIALFTDGLRSYATVFPKIFGTPYQPTRNGERGRYQLPRYRIPRQLAHVQIVKHQSDRRLESVEVRYTHGSKKRIDQALKTLGFTVPNTSYIERRNGTARLMNISQVRKTLAFSKDKKGKQWLGWWTTTVYNWCRENRSL